MVSPAEKATGLATVGVTWNQADRLSEDQLQVDVRTRKDGRWSTWTALEYHDDHGPDASEAEGRRERAGTEPSVVGHVQSGPGARLDRRPAARRATSSSR